MPGFFGPFFYQLIVLKMAIFYSNFTVIVCFLVIFVIIIIKITKIIIIIIIETIIIIIKKIGTKTLCGQSSLSSPSFLSSPSSFSSPRSFSFRRPLSSPNSSSVQLLHSDRLCFGGAPHIFQIRYLGNMSDKVELLEI